MTETELPRPLPGPDRRRERRYPVVGIGVLYSPTEGRCLDNAGQLVREAVAVDVSLTGLSFDVREALAPGEELVIELDDPAGGPAERILAEVRWCRQVEDAHFRIGTRIKETVAADRDGDEADTAARPIGRGLPVPSGVDLRCPACGGQSEFTLLGLQPGNWKAGVMPLYQCGICDSSRSITSILAYNRGTSV